MHSNQDVPKQKNETEKDSIVKKKMRLIGPISDETSYQIFFHVTSRPSQFVPILIGKDKSIHRKLVLDLYNMNFERWKPVQSYDETTNHGKEEYVLENKGVLPIRYIINSSLVTMKDEMSASFHSNDETSSPSATLELQLDLSYDKNHDHHHDGRKQMEQELLHNMVTEKNWRHHHHRSVDGQGLNRIDDDDSSKDPSHESQEEMFLASHHKATSANPNKKDMLMDTKEYSFLSEFEAGSFQTLYLALNTVGEEIRNMYSALELVHKQSLAYGGSFYGDSNNHKTDKMTFSGVALDDVQRCLGDLPFVHKRLNRIYDDLSEIRIQNQQDLFSNQNEPSLIASAADEDQDSSLIGRSDKRQNQSNRILLGYVDFFRLFVPTLFHHTPYKNACAASSGEIRRYTDKDAVEVHQARARQLVKLQKRVAMASVRVCAYSNAMVIAHQGWKLNLIEGDHANQVMKKRLAFDLEEMNSKFDEASVNQYYDPPVSPRCMDDTQNYKSASADLRAYAVVGCHNIILSSQEDSHSLGLSFTSDPVLQIPSLRKIVENNPELDFLILCFYLRGTCTIILFVRYGAEEEEGGSHPSSVRHISEQFERCANFDLRIKLDDQSYHGHSTSLMNRFVNFILNTDRQCTKYETISLSNANELVCHFPSASSQSSVLTNYFGVNYLIDPIGFTPSHAFRLLRSLVPLVGTSPNIIDLSVLQRKGGKDMRCLASIRIVHLDPNNSQRVLHDESGDYALSTNFPDSIKSLDSDICSMEDIELVKEILTDISVPTKELGDSHTVSVGSNTIEALTDSQVLNFFSNDDIRRHFIAANMDLKETAVRLTESAAWRGLTLPIDKRKCAIELQSKQFFMQGVDRRGNPVFYFRNMCKGLWRKDIDASISAVIYQFENAIQTLLKTNPSFKCTLVVLMGKPHRIEGSTTVSVSNEDDSRQLINQNDETFQRIGPDNVGFHAHTNFHYVHKLINIMTKNYPERLMIALLVPNGGWGKFIGGANIRRYVNSSRTRSRIIMLDNHEDLLKYISPNQLVDIAGGNIPII